MQDQLDALTLSPLNPDVDTAPNASPPASCQQCMGLSQLSFAASTLSPAIIHNHEHSVISATNSTHAHSIPNTHSHNIPSVHALNMHTGHDLQASFAARSMFQASMDMASLRNNLDVGPLQMNGVKLEKESA